MKEDVTLVVGHSAPMLLRSRGGALKRHDAILRTPARLRHVPILDRQKVRIVGQGRRERATLSEFEGRLWLPMGFGQGPVSVAEAVGELSLVDGSRHPQLRHLRLDPWDARNHYGALSEPARLAEGTPVAPDRIAFDLRAEAQAEAARRIEERLLHDGEKVWYALPRPVLDAQSSEVACVEEAYFIDKLPLHAVSLPENVERYIDYLSNGPSLKRITDHRVERIRRAARTLSHELGDQGYDPSADLLHGVGRLAIKIHRAALAACAGRGPGHEAVSAPAQALVPIVLRASAGLLREDDLPVAVDRLRACVEAGLSPERRAIVGSSQIQYAFRDAEAYLAYFAVPLMAERSAPQADVDSLGTLAPCGGPR